MKFIQKDFYDIGDLLTIMQLLRSEEGCPWDREQTHESIRNNFVEETYEAVDAIDQNDMEALKEELGDVLLQIVFHCELERDKHTFDFSQVVNDICQKLIIRHPHVFADTRVSGSGEVLKNWDSIKKQTKGQNTYTQTLQSVPRAFPALMRCQKVQARAAKSALESQSIEQAANELDMESKKLQQQVASGNLSEAAKQLGSVLFSVTNLARYLHCDSEQMAHTACDSYIENFAALENGNK